MALGLVALYWYGAKQNSIRANTDPTRNDQAAYINYAKKILREDYSHIGNRNRMPIYPFVLSFALNEKHSLSVDFFRAKYFSIALSLGLLLGIGALLFRLFTPLEATTLLLIAAFSLYIFKAAYVSAELLYYSLATFLFALMLRFLTLPSFGLAIAIGSFAGLAHLTKASLPPALAIFLAVALAWGVVTAVRGAVRQHAKASIGELAGHLGNLTLVVAFFLLTVFPYIKNSVYRFGRPFYNVNSTFYVWYDSWKDAESGTKAHGDRGSWPDMPADEIPSFAKYLREHTPEDLVGRVVNGSRRSVFEALESYGYAKYVGIFSVTLLVSAWIKRKALCLGISRYPHVIAFVAMYFLGYGVVNAWFYDFVDGNRLALALYIPLLLVCALGLRYLLRGSSIQAFGHRLEPLQILYVLILLIVVLDIYSLLTTRLLFMYGGS